MQALVAWNCNTGSDTLAPVARNSGRTNRRTVYEALRRKVLTLELPPGAAISENELAAVLGVSRTPIRESIVLLAEEGLVQVFPHVGTFVSRVDPQRVADAQFLREAVELTSLGQLSAPLDATIVAEIEQNLVAQQAPALSHDDFFELDEAFHHGLLRLAGHGNAWATVQSAKGHLDRARRLGLRSKTPPQLAAQHVAVFDAVRAGDLDGARRAMQTHLRAVFHDVETLQEESPELFAPPLTAAPVRRSIAVWE